MPGFFASGIVNFFRKGDDGKYTLAMAMPDTAPLPIFAAEADSGKFVKAALLRRDETLGKNVLAATTYRTPKELVQDFQELFPEDGKDAQFFQLPEEMFMNALVGMGRPEWVAEELVSTIALSFSNVPANSVDSGRTCVWLARKATLEESLWIGHCPFLTKSRRRSRSMQRMRLRSRS